MVLLVGQELSQKQAAMVALESHLQLLVLALVVLVVVVEVAMLIVAAV
jgi:hypothetical protein